MSGRPASWPSRALIACAAVVGLTFLACCFGLLRSCGRISDAHRNAESAIPLLAALAAEDHASPDALRAAVRRAGEQWAATLGDDDYEVLLARTGQPFEQVLARNFAPMEARDLAIAQPYGAHGEPAIPGRCMQDGRPIAHANAEVRVGAERWIVHFTDFHR